MATGNASNPGNLGVSSAEGGSSQSQPLSNDEVVQAVRFLNAAVPRMHQQEKVVQQLNGAVFAGFIVLLITVAALVISCVLNYTQTITDVSMKNSELLNDVNEQLIRLENSVQDLENPRTKK